MEHEVMIVGGGIAGLTLAVKLASCNIDVLLVEKDEKSGTIYKGELLQPKSLEILNQLGVYDQIKQHGEALPSIEMIEYHQDEKGLELLGRNEFRYDILNSRFNTSVMIPHEKLKEILFREARKHPTFVHLKPARFTGFTYAKGKRKARVALPDREQLVSAKFYVGAEGRVSPVRNEMKVTLKKHSYNHHFLTVSFPRPASLKSSKIITTQEKFLGLFPLPDNQVRSVLLIKPGEYKLMRKQGLDSFYQAYIDLMPELEGFVNQIQSWKQIQLMIPLRHNASRYVEDNCILVGDAAHSVHPMAGEGMNLAIQDADVLGELLCWMYETGQLEFDHLKGFEQVRKPRAEFVSRLSHQAALMYSFSTSTFQKLRMKGISNTERNKKLHFKQMLNTSGLGIWRFSLFDRMKQAGFVPSFIGGNTISDSEQLTHFFTKEDDYPWMK
ncbi:NAD(P)/FAD-dependent oxidoreductase [Pseudalkalibacillus sp. SCS-8]|uniref:FAD-dependent oxidoreductase n=1 Tax=Pseudalkalibacillus nanhaiensis TaxID=3115291 RepID=UPI0032DBD54B